MLQQQCYKNDFADAIHGIHQMLANDAVARKVLGCVVTEHASKVGKLIGGPVVASIAARLAIHQPISAEPHVDDRLAQAAVLLALALRFDFLALHAALFCGSGARAHEARLSPASRAMERD
jgi:hypothetical protein